MTVYQVKPDVNRYQSLELVDTNLATDPLLSFDGRPKLDYWQPFEVYCDNPVLPAGDFWHIAVVGTIAATRKALAVVRHHFELAGEMLPFVWEDQELTLLNITNLPNVLDHTRTEWLIGSGGNRIKPQTSRKNQCVFRPELFNISSLFKVPELRISMLCWERDGNPKTEFKAAVEQSGLTGLYFEELWSDR